MASSRKQPPKADRFESAIEAILDEAATQHPKLRDKAAESYAVAVAFSGGADSTLLLETAAHVAKRRGLRLVALHVHHGLSPNADSWAESCTRATREIDVPLRIAKVRVKRGAGDSLEARARTARYTALASLCGELELPILLTGHHADDVVETVFLNLIRGAGVAGLSGIAAHRDLGQTILLRPFLGFRSEEMRHALRLRGSSWVEDDSNQNENLRRNAMRHRLLPAVEQMFPGARNQVLRVAFAAVQAQQILDERGSEDLEKIAADATGFSVSGLRTLSHARAVNALRSWFRIFRGHAPSSAFVNDLFRQLLGETITPHAQMQHAGEQFFVVNGRLTTIPLLVTEPPVATQIQWAGESELELPAWGGKIRFEPEAAEGVSPTWLRSVTLTVRPRQGGERMRLAANRPSRSLKNLYQEIGIPVQLRPRLPLLYADNKLIWAAGIGADARVLAQPGQPHVRLTWGTLPRTSQEGD